MRYGWIIILWCMTAFPVMAQRMRIEDFGRYKRPFLQKASLRQTNGKLCSTFY